MATSRTQTAEKKTSRELTTERNAFRPGEQVEFDGALAKVVNYGYLELPSAPGQDIQFSDKLALHLQLPALTPGGPVEYARFVPVDEVTSLRDNPKRQRELQMEFAPLFGDAAPMAEGKYTEPNTKGVTGEGREPSKRSGAEGVDRIVARNQRQPVDLSRTQAADGKKVSTTETATEKGTPKKAARKSGSKKASAKKAAAK